MKQINTYILEKLVINKKNTNLDLLPQKIQSMDDLKKVLRFYIENLDDAEYCNYYKKLKDEHPILALSIRSLNRLLSLLYGSEYGLDWDNRIRAFQDLLNIVQYNYPDFVETKLCNDIFISIMNGDNRGNIKELINYCKEVMDNKLDNKFNKYK